MREFQEIFTKLLKEKGIKQADLARLLNIKPQSVSLYCTGKNKPDFENLIKIADCFGVTLDYLMKGEIKENAPIRKELGLTENAIEHIQALADKDILNALLEVDTMYTLLNEIKTKCALLVSSLSELKNTREFEALGKDLQIDFFKELMNVVTVQVAEKFREFIIKHFQEIFNNMLKRSKQSGTPEKVQN